VPGGGGWDCWSGGGGGRIGRFATWSLGGGPGGGGGKGGGGNDADTALAGFGGMGGGGGNGKDAGKTVPSAELALLLPSGSGGGGGGGGTANTSSSVSIAEDEAAPLDEAPDKGILGPAFEHNSWLMSTEESNQHHYRSMILQDKYEKQAQHTYRWFKHRRFPWWWSPSRI